MEYDCGFTKEQNWFRYRAAAIIIEDDCVLFVGNERENYYYSVGGGVHMNEKAEDAVMREVYEETGVHYEIDHLAVIHENFFDGDGTIEGYHCHEIALYYRMKSRGTKALHSNSYTGDVREHMYWIPIAELAQHRAYPSFMADYLAHETDGVVHIVTDERRISCIDKSRV